MTEDEKTQLAADIVAAIRDAVHAAQTNPRA